MIDSYSLPLTPQSNPRQQHHSLESGLAVIFVFVEDPIGLTPVFRSIPLSLEKGNGPIILLEERECPLAILDVGYTLLTNLCVC